MPSKRKTENAERRSSTNRSFARAALQIERARSLRRAATGSEKIAWELLRSLGRDGFFFRRQQPLGRRIVDFCCLKERLIVELDGSVHAQPSQQRRDTKRDAELEVLGYRVARYPNGIVVQAPEEFLKRMRALLTGPKDPRTPFPSPPRGRGEQRS
ncbi:MAG: endonuclease domain-containing protein [Terriglobia bacterium]